MANKVDELEVLIKANTEQFNAGLKNVESKINAFQSGANKVGKAASVATSAVGTAIGIIATKAFSAISSQIDGAISRLDTLNNYSKVMSNLGIATSVSSASVTKLSDALQGLPTNLSDAVSSVQRFTAINNSLEYSTDAYLALNNAILASGASTQMQASALEQLTQAYSKGKPEMQDWKTAIQTMPAQLKQIGLAMGYASTTQLYDALQSGEITMQDFMNTVLKLNTDGVAGFASFSEQARSATGGVQTSITNLKIAFQRGLASIMDAIGQTNISGFINRVASAIGTVANYVAAFVKLIKQAVAWIGALFGGSGSTENLVKETKTAGDSMAGVASGASDVAGGLSDANGQAKKLKHTLAGFDEMNVLTEQESGGSGGAGGGAGGGIDMSDYKWDNSEITSATDKVAEAVEKIKKAFKDLFGEINFTPLGNSIIKLWNGIRNAIDGALKIGEQFLEKFIVPLSKYAIENTIPRMFTAVGDALAGINFDVIAESFGNVFSALSGIGMIIQDIVATVTEWVMPIVEWIANFVVPPALEIIATILNTIGAILGGIWDGIKTMYENWIKPALEHLGKALEPILNVIRDLFKGVNDNSDAWEGFKDLISGVVKATLEWLFEFLGVIIETIATLIDWVIQAGKWVVETCGKIGEWVGNLATEIGNWFQNAWDTIVGIFQGIGQWFSDRWDDVKNVFSSIGSWFGGIFSGAWSAITSVFGSIGSWFNGRWNDIKNVFSNVWSVFSEIGSNIWEGLKSGIGNIAQKMKDIFTGAVDAVKNFLGIHSPSKLFAQLGGYVSEGFANGIESEYDRVQDAFQEMAMVDTDDIVTESTLNINSSIGEDLNEIENKPISLLLKIDGESIPISAERIADTINDASFLMNKNILNI